MGQLTVGVFHPWWQVFRASNLSERLVSFDWHGKFTGTGVGIIVRHSRTVARFHFALSK